MKSEIESILNEAIKLSSDLYDKNLLMFIGAGFSKNIDKMPDFYELVRDDILLGYFLDIKDNQNELNEFLELKEIEPENCLSCILNSFEVTFQDYDDFGSKIKEVELLDCKNSNLKDVLEYIKDVSSKDNKEINDLIEDFKSKKIDKKDLKNLAENISDKDLDCAKDCGLAKWETANKDDYLLLGLFKFYLENEDIHFINLLEYIQRKKGKQAIAKYAFEKNKRFKKFDELIDEYQKNNYSKVGEAQLVVARLAKEGLIHQIITTNWDDLIELACYAVGMYIRTSNGKIYGRIGEKLDKNVGTRNLEYKDFVNYTTAISEKKDFYNSENLLAPTKKTFYIHKIHGSIDNLLGHNYNEEDSFNKNFIITHRDLIDWRKDYWAKDFVKSVLRSHDVIFGGISGGDNVVYATVRKLVEEFNSVYEGNDSNNRKTLYSVGISKELLLNNMLSSSNFNSNNDQTNSIDSEIVAVENEVNYQGKQLGTDLFYRWFYSLFILNYYNENIDTYVRKTVEYICDGQFEYEKFSKFKKVIKEFIDYITRENEENKKRLSDLNVKFLDLIYHIIPKSIIYCWLINNRFSSIHAETGGLNFLIKKPHYYLPVLSYYKWFTIYLYMFAKIYNYLKENWNSKSDNRLHITKDGVFVLDNVAFILLIEEDKCSWSNLQKAGAMKFSPETTKKINACYKKQVFSIKLNSEDEKVDAAKQLRYFIDRFFNFERIKENQLINNNKLIKRIEGITNGK